MAHDSDKDLREMAELELSESQEKIEKIIEDIKILLIPKDPNDDKNVIVEIRGAAGGDEANIFAGDLFRMYSRYADKVGWKIEVINSEAGTAGGFSQIEAKIKGENVYSKLKYESGSHRVQRVPEENARDEKERRVINSLFLTKNLLGFSVAKKYFSL